MNLNKIVFLVFIIAFTNCHNDKKSNEIVESSDNLILIDNKEREQLTLTIESFLNWYKKNELKLNEIELVNNSINEIVDSTKFYSVNFKNTEIYLNEFQKSDLFSNNYIENQRNYFKKCDLYFQDNHEYDGPPSGFDYDLILLSQDVVIDDLIRNLKIENIKLKDKKAELTANYGVYYQLTFWLTNFDDIWKIDKIENTTQH